MNCAGYRIAGLQMLVKGGPTVARLSTLPGFPLFGSCKEGADCTVLTDCSVALPDGELLYAFNNEELGCRYEFVKGVASYGFAIIPNDGSNLFALRYDGGNYVTASSTDDPDTLRFAMWVAFALLAMSHGVVSVHASTIVHQGKAVVFLGESGTGKSTHTRLWLRNIPNTALLNDDSPMLSIANSEPLVWGSPWSGKTHCYHNSSFPLAAVVRLCQAPYNTITKLSPLESFAALQPSLPPILAQDMHYTDMMVDIISAVLKSVPAYRLQCMPNREAALTSYNAIFGTV